MTPSTKGITTVEIFSCCLREEVGLGACWFRFFARSRRLATKREVCASPVFSCFFFLVILDTLRLILKTPTSTPNVTFPQLRRDDAPHLPDSSRKSTSRFNPLSTGQSKIGRRRPISLDYHCVNISQRIFINKISLERSFHYLNADTLFLKIGQEMTPLQPFEVTQLIDFALDRSTSVTCGRDFAHSITMVT